MNKNILKINFSKLKKIEIQYLAESVIMIVEKHNPETLKIKEIFDILVEQKPQIKLLKLGYAAHPITSDLVKLRSKRDTYAQGMINQIKTTERLKESGMEAALNVAKPIVFLYLHALSRKTEKEIRQTLIQLFDLVQEDEELDAAISTLDLSGGIDNLQSVNDAIDLQYDRRRGKVSARPKMNTLEIVASLKSDMLDLFKQIEVAQIKNQELDYTKLIDELNDEIALAKAEAKARASYNKKKAENALNDDVVVEDNEVVIEGETEGSSESSQSAQRMYPMNVEADDIDENSELLDIEKTVAVPRKQLRLPDISTEA